MKKKTSRNHWTKCIQ